MQCKIWQEINLYSILIYFKATVVLKTKDNPK